MHRHTDTHTLVYGIEVLVFAQRKKHSRSNKGIWGSLNHTMSGCSQAHHSSLLEAHPCAAWWGRRPRVTGGPAALGGQCSPLFQPLLVAREPQDRARHTWTCQQERLQRSGHLVGTGERRGWWRMSMVHQSTCPSCQPAQSVLSPLIKPHFWWFCWARAYYCAYRHVWRSQCRPRHGTRCTTCPQCSTCSEGGCASEHASDSEGHAGLAGKQVKWPGSGTCLYRRDHRQHWLLWNRVGIGSHGQLL